MAERRMFSKAIIDSDDFLSLPLSAQALYFHLSMRADDDGFINNAKRIMRMIAASDTDLEALCELKFVIPFESGIVVIRHWKIHNYIQKDRYKPTIFKEEKQQLEAKINEPYTKCIHNVSNLDTQDRLGKDRLELGKVIYADKPPRNSSHFVPPSIDEVKSYCLERKNSVDAERFIDYYTSNGWKVGKNKMKDWKSAVRSWEHNNYCSPSQNGNMKRGVNGITIDETKTDLDKLF